MMGDGESRISERPPEKPGRLDYGVVMVATISSALFTSLLAGAGVVGGDTAALQRAAGPAVVAITGGLQLARRRPRPLHHLGVGSLALAYHVWLLGPDRSAVMGLTAMAMVGVLFVRRRVWLYVGGATVALALASIYWVPPDRPPLARLADGSGLTVLFVFTASLVHWMRAELEASRARYRNLFYRARVPIWEIDYSSVAQWLDRRRAEGVSDIRRYLESHPAALAEVASLARVLEVNAAAMEFVGATKREQVIGPIDVTLVAEGVKDALVTQLEALWKRKEVARAEISIERPDGTIADGEMSWAASFRGGKQELSNVVTTVTDITERNRDRERLEELVRAKDDFVASISHEVRTPLTAVVGLADELATRFDDFGRFEVQEMMALISDQSLEVAYIVEDLLVAARREVGSLVIDPTAVDLQREVLAVTSSLAFDVRVNADLRSTTPLTWADPARVRQVLRNLLVNAERHGGGSTRVRVRFNAANTYVEVRDAGPPIPAEQRQVIFARYYSAPPSAGLTASVGLGLTVSRQLAQMMGGDISYAHDGCESVFTLSLPNARTDVPAAVGNSNPASVAGRSIVSGSRV